MTKYQLYKLLQKNSQLKDERHPMFEKNKFMKFLAWFYFFYMAAILLLMGVTLPLGMSGAYNGVAAFHVFDGGFFYLLIIDFWSRFMLQETPAQQVKDYRLLPISRRFLMHMYLTRSILSVGNLFWAFFLLPFGMIAIAPLLGWGALCWWLLCWWLMIVANSLLYQFTRALCMRHMLWFIPMLLIHAGIVCLAVLPKHNVLDMPCTLYLYHAALGHVWPLLAVLPIIALAYWANYALQSRMVYNEVAKKEEVDLKHASQMSFLERFGIMGEYLKMEIKLRLRNKQVRMAFFMGLGLMMMLSGLQYFTDVYDGSFMTSFICLYDYIVLGMMTLVTIMGFEGNYIDGLMARRESIHALLQAKYYFNSVLLIIPFLILIPLMISGKTSVWLNLGYLFFTVGVLYPMIFQLAVYNKDTIPLNQKLTGKQANMAQNIVSISILFVPIGFEKASVLLLGDPWGYVVLIVLGIIGLATHRLWLRNIYQRFMQRRYINMEGFRASRNS